MLDRTRDATSSGRRGHGYFHHPAEVANDDALKSPWRNEPDRPALDLRLEELRELAACFREMQRLARAAGSIAAQSSEAVRPWPERPDGFGEVVLRFHRSAITTRSALEALRVPVRRLERRLRGGGNDKATPRDVIAGGLEIARQVLDAVEELCSAAAALTRALKSGGAGEPYCLTSVALRRRGERLIEEPRHLRARMDALGEILGHG